MQPLVLVACPGSLEECGDGEPWSAGVRAVLVEVRDRWEKPKGGGKDRVYLQPEHLCTTHLPDAGLEEEVLWCVSVAKEGREKETFKSRRNNTVEICSKRCLQD